MARETNPQHAQTQSNTQQSNNSQRQQPRMQTVVIASHGQGQVRNPETDRRLKANRD